MFKMLCINVLGRYWQILKTALEIVTRIKVVVSKLLTLTCYK